MQIIIMPLGNFSIWTVQQMRQEKLKRTSVPNVSYHRYIYLTHTHTRSYEGACLCMRAFISLVALLISSLAHSNGNSCRIMPIKFVLLKNSFAKKFHKSNKYRVALRQSLRDDGVGWEVCGGLENWGGAVNMPHEWGRHSTGGSRTKIPLCLLGHQFLKSPWAAPSELWPSNSKGIKSIKTEISAAQAHTYIYIYICLSIYWWSALGSSRTCG